MLLVFVFVVVVVDDVLFILGVIWRAFISCTPVVLKYHNIYPTMTGRSTSGLCWVFTVGFSPTRQTSRGPSAKRREVFGESYEG